MITQISKKITQIIGGVMRYALCVVRCALCVMGYSLLFAAVCFSEEIKLEKIVVTPSRLGESYRNSTANVSIIEEDALKQAGITQVSQILETLPSVEILDYGSYGSTKTVHTRGVSSAQVITLIDGRPANTPRDGVADFNQISTSNIERIEVLKGPASNIYGANAVGGVINIITKSGTKERYAEASTGYGTYSTRKTTFSHGWQIKDSIDYFLNAEWLKSSGHRTNSDYEAYNFNGKIGYDTKDFGKISLSSGTYLSEVGAPGLNSAVDKDDRQEDDKHYFDLNWEGLILGELNLLLKLYHNVDRMEFIETETPLEKFAHQTKLYGVDLQFSKIWFDIFRSTFGASLQEHKNNSSNSAKHKYDLKAGYFEAEFEPIQDLTLKAGARIDDYSNFGNKISPSASFSWWLRDKIKLHGLAAKSFRAPTFNDLYWPREDWGAWGGVEGNPNLRPERATSYEIGCTATPYKLVDFDVTYFNTKFKDLINWTVDNSLWWRPSNVGSAKIKGIEADFNLSLIKDLALNLNYTYLEAKDADTDRFLIYRPNNQYKARLSYNWKNKINLYLSSRYVTHRYTRTDNSARLKGYIVMDGNLSYKINENKEIFLNMNNLFDRDYQEEEDYPMPGANFLFGIKANF